MQGTYWIDSTELGWSDDPYDFGVDRRSADVIELGNRVRSWLAHPWGSGRCVPQGSVWGVVAVDRA